MTTLTELIENGKALGHTGKELQDWVNAEREREKERENAEREREKERENAERERERERENAERQERLAEMGIRRIKAEVTKAKLENNALMEEAHVFEMVNGETEEMWRSDNIRTRVESGQMGVKLIQEEYTKSNLGTADTNVKIEQLSIRLGSVEELLCNILKKLQVINEIAAAQPKIEDMLNVVINRLDIIETFVELSNVREDISQIKVSEEDKRQIKHCREKKEIVKEKCIRKLPVIESTTFKEINNVVHTKEQRHSVPRRVDKCLSQPLVQPNVKGGVDNWGNGNLRYNEYQTPRIIVVKKKDILSCNVPVKSTKKHRYEGDSGSFKKINVRRKCPVNGDFFNVQMKTQSRHRDNLFVSRGKFDSRDHVGKRVNYMYHGGDVYRSHRMTSGDMCHMRRLAPYVIHCCPDIYSTCESIQGYNEYNESCNKLYHKRKSSYRFFKNKMRDLNSNWREH